MGVESKVGCLIVDTSAFIKNADLQNIGEVIITEPSVVDEIKSKRQLKRLVVLPYDLVVKEAYPEDIKFVTEFSKKTGDYTSLSATDIKVMALTYHYEREKVGTSHLRQEPEKKKQVVDSSIKKEGNFSKLPIGFYTPKIYKDNQDNTKEDSHDKEKNDDDDWITAKNKKTKYLKRTSVMKSTKDCNNKNFPKEDDNHECEEDEYEVDEEGSAYDNEDNEYDDEENNKHNIEKDGKGNNKHKNEKDDDNNDDQDNGDVEDDEDDDNGWITPQNLKDEKKKMDSGLIKEKPATVACLTMDYSMQNVLMQIGLNVASLEGKVIKEMRTFILRCYSCAKTTGMVTKVFCPHCGNKTLKKVAVSLDDDGNQIIHINFKKPLTTRGKKFSLPTFQGGKHACNPILFEDQPMPDQRPTKLGRTKNDPLNEDFIAGYSPFVMRDVNSRAAMLNIKSGHTVKHWMKRNPNEVRKYKK